MAVVVFDWIDGERRDAGVACRRVSFARDVAAFLAALQRMRSDGRSVAGTHSFFRGHRR